MTDKTCVAVVVKNNENKILLAKERNDKPYEKAKGLWTVPVGKVETGEGLLDAAIREVKEEVGYDIKLIDVIGVYHFPSDKNGDAMLGVAFRAEIISNKTSNAELKDIHWISVKNIAKSKIKFRKGMRRVIEDYQDNKTFPMNKLRYVLNTYGRSFLILPTRAGGKVI